MEEEAQPCPGCGRKHVSREDHDVLVECQCGLTLARHVPIYAAFAPPFGWRWSAICTSCGDMMTDVEVAYCNAMLMVATCSACRGGD